MITRTLSRGTSLTTEDLSAGRGRSILTYRGGCRPRGAAAPRCCGECGHGYGDQGELDAGAEPHGRRQPVSYRHDDTGRGRCSLVGLVHDLSLIHISEPTRLGMISYAVFCLKKKK